MTFPEEFVSSMKRVLGEETQAFLETLETEPPTSIRLNPRKVAKPNFELGGQIPWNKEGHYLQERPVFTLDPAFHTGAYYVQEASSQVVGYIFDQIFAGRTSPMKVLDLCAAPGGKTTHLASKLSDNDFLVANEVIKSRVNVLKENLQKWGFNNIIVSNQDPETFADLEGFFDLVLVDAPCSGEGMFRKNMEAVGEWSAENVQLCSGRQKRILSAAAMLVAPGGYLIYSTCTYNQEENQGNAKWLSRTLDFENVELEIPEDWGVLKANPGLQFFSHKLMGEGFYVSVFKNLSNEQKFVKGKPQIERLPKKLAEELNTWVRDAGKYQFFRKNDGQVIAIPEHLLSEYGSVLKALTKRSSGLEIGLFKGSDFIPSHALALSGLVAESIEKLELSEQDALRFLRKENFDIGNLNSGWKLVSYQNLPLGWIKVVGERLNNYMPTEYRIRMV